jgi:hypothetical protein
MIPSEPLFHKPKDIIAAKNIIYATMFLGVIGWVISKMSNGLPDQVNSQNGMIDGLIVTIVNLLIQFILARQIGLGKKWARTVYLILFVLGIVISFFMLPMFKVIILLAVVYLIQMILQILTLRFLYSQKSTHWFNSVRAFVPEPGK